MMHDTSRLGLVQGLEWPRLNLTDGMRSAEHDVPSASAMITERIIVMGWMGAKAIQIDF
jgi:hypothetical protein